MDAEDARKRKLEDNAEREPEEEEDQDPNEDVPAPSPKKKLRRKSKTRKRKKNKRDEDSDSDSWPSDSDFEKPYIRELEGFEERMKDLEKRIPIRGPGIDSEVEDTEDHRTARSYC